jgi:Rrf2 family transcriptional regulator, cysteine metabolism repressor
MRISTRGRYGLRAMVELARHHGDSPVLMRSITESQGIPRKYLHAILTALRSNGLVRSIRGSRGGYALTRPADEITALDIVRALEGEITVVDCGESGQACERSSACPTRTLWAAVSASIAAQLGAVTLAELARRGRSEGVVEPRAAAGVHAGAGTRRSACSPRRG